MCGGPAETKPLLENTPKKEIEERSVASVRLVCERMNESDCIHIRLLYTCAFIKICDVEMHIMEDELVFCFSFVFACCGSRMQILMKNGRDKERRKRAQSVITFDFFETILRATVGPVFSFLRDVKKGEQN